MADQAARLDAGQGGDEKRTEAYMRYGEGASQSPTQPSAKSNSGVPSSAREQAGAARSLELPVAVVSPVDVGRLVRELEALDEFLRQAAVRKPGESMVLPRTSKLLEEIAKGSQCNLLVESERQHLLDFMREVKSKAPVLHMSFAADPSPMFLRRLMEWLRREIHPMVLLQIGLQPTIAAGCVVRTPDKYFDFSLRQHFMENRDLLIERLGALKQV